MLVSNTDRALGTQLNFDSIVYAQGFTTGGLSVGYSLENIQANMQMAVPDASTVRAELWSSTDVGTLDVKLLDLAVPQEITTGAVAFKAPQDTTLAANTAYHFVIYTTGCLDDLEIDATYSGAEDAGGASGWSIANGAYISSGNTPENPAWQAASGGYSLQISVVGSGGATAPALVPRWSSVLTAKNLGLGVGCVSRDGQPQCSDHLSDSVITYNGVNYNVLVLRVAYHGTLRLILDKEVSGSMQQDLRLNAGKCPPVNGVL